MIYAARIILAHGETCSTGGMKPYPWISSRFPLSAGEYDYWTALLHEFGHALGFVDDNSIPSVMNTPLPSYPTLRRHLFREDIARLRATYGPIRSRPLHTSTTGPDVFGRPNYQPEPLTVFSVGQSACFNRTPHLLGKIISSPLPKSIRELQVLYRHTSPIVRQLLTTPIYTTKRQTCPRLSLVVTMVHTCWHLLIRMDS
jgi:hypothetical protein